MPEAVRSTLDALSEATALLHGAGVPAARREALRLWTVTTGQSMVLAGPGAAPGRADVERFRQAITRRASGEPWQYAAGATGFRRLTIACDHRALIPRPETEGLIDLALGLCGAGRALDLGTGTGCIALALADEGAYAAVTGVDASADALALARENGAACGLQVRWLHGDWADPVGDDRFDLIVSNPPYIATAEVDRLDTSVLDYEPRMALDGGPDGLDAPRAAIEAAARVAAPGAWLILEVDASRSAHTVELARAAGWNSVRITADLYGRDRYLTACREPDHAR